MARGETGGKPPVSLLKILIQSAPVNTEARKTSTADATEAIPLIKEFLMVVVPESPIVVPFPGTGERGSARGVCLIKNLLFTTARRRAGRSPMKIAVRENFMNVGVSERLGGVSSLCAAFARPLRATETSDRRAREKKNDELEIILRFSEKNLSSRSFGRGGGGGGGGGGNSAETGNFRGFEQSSLRAFCLLSLIPSE